MKKLDIITKRGSTLNGILFDNTNNPNTVVIAITGIHGNFYSNPFYYNFADTLNGGNIDFIYAQTNDAFSQIQTFNAVTKKQELIGSWNEKFDYADEDIGAYLDFARNAGYKSIILSGHSLGANKVIYYLSRHDDKRVKKFILLSPANIKHLTNSVSEFQKDIIINFVTSGHGDDILPFELFGWIYCTANTAHEWVFNNILDNVHVEKDGDFLQIKKINHTGALLIGTYDNFTYGDPSGFLKNINDNFPNSHKNKLIFIENTGHTYQRKQQETAQKLLNLINEWKNLNEI